MTEREDSSANPSGSSHSRGPKKSENVRKQMLMSDGDIREVQRHHVICKGCGKKIQLDKKTTYVAKPWLKHKAGCPQLTGKKRIRVSGKVNDTEVRISIIPKSDDAMVAHN